MNVFTARPRVFADAGVSVASELWYAYKALSNSQEPGCWAVTAVSADTLQFRSEKVTFSVETFPTLVWPKASFQP